MYSSNHNLEKKVKRMTEEKLETIDWLCEYLKIQKATAYGWIHRKKIPAICISRKMVRFRKSDIDSWIENRTQGVRQQAASMQKPVLQNPKCRPKKKSAAAETYIDSLVEAARREAGAGGGGD